MMRLLRMGDSGDDVAMVQTALNHHIRRLKTLDSDGKFGLKTDARVREFQSSNQLQVDGVVGPNTLNKLVEESTYEFRLAVVGFVEQYRSNSHRFGDGPPRPWLGPPLMPLPIPGLSPLPAPGLPGQQNPPPILPRLLPPSFTPINSSVNLWKWNSGETAVLNMRLTFPTRNDPRDPIESQRKLFVDFIDRIPTDKSIRVFLIDQIPKVEKQSLPERGWHWHPPGVKPVLSDILDGKLGLKVANEVSLVVRPFDSGPLIEFGGQGELKGSADFSQWRSQTGPKLELEYKALVFGKVFF